jgi:phage baseplate assembly protein W
MKPVVKLGRTAVRRIRSASKSARKKWEFRLKTLKISIKSKQKGAKPID